MKIEEVYQKFRTDGKNKQLPDFQFFMKEAEKDLKYTNALRDFFNFEIKEENLQAEYERICSNTKQPEILKEIFQALENDPNLIAEVFVRSVFVKRLIESYYYQEEKFQKPLRDKVKEELKRIKYASDLKNLSGDYQETIISKRNKKGGYPEKNVIKYNEFEFENFLNNLAKKFNYDDKNKLQIGNISKVIEDREGIRVIGILDKGSNHIKICSSFWRKTRFSKWWQEMEKGISSKLDFKKGNLKMPILRYGSCKDDSWYKLPGPPDERYDCAGGKVSTKFVVWGGKNDEEIPLNTGFVYDPSSDSWTEMSNINAPSARTEFSFYITGQYFVVWGGVDTQGNYLNTGAYYNISNNTWTTIETNGEVPSGRKNAIALSAYNIFMIMFGGENASGKLNDYYFYSTITKSWLKNNAPNPPSARAGVKAVVKDNTYILFWGGRGAGDVPLNDGKIYNCAMGAWQSIASAPAGNARYEHTMVYYNGKAYIWGGLGTSFNPLNTGIIYDYVGNSWSTMSSSPLSPRHGHSAVLVSDNIIFWGAEAVQIIMEMGQNTVPPAIAGHLLHRVPRKELIILLIGLEQIY